MYLNKFVYLCGPIAGRTNNECFDWRNKATNFLQPLSVLNPMRRDYRNKKIIIGETDKTIVENDKLDILNSSAIIVYYDIPSVGTSMEIIYAWENKIPVYLVNNSIHKLSYQGALSPWLTYHSNYIFDNLEDACNSIKNDLLINTV